MTQDQTIDHGDHEHSVEEVLGLMGARIEQLHERLHVAGMHNTMVKMALEKLLPNIGDSVTIDIENIELLNEVGERAKSVTYFRDVEGVLDLRAD